MRCDACVVSWFLTDGTNRLLMYSSPSRLFGTHIEPTGNIVSGVVARCMYSGLVGGLLFAGVHGLRACLWWSPASLQSTEAQSRIESQEQVQQEDAKEHAIGTNNWFPALVCDCLCMPNHHVFL